MRILITNDDGIDFPNVLSLAKWAMQYGEVVICAPEKEQSAKSQSINLRTDFRIRKRDILPGADCFSVDSTPADCVRFAMAHYHWEFDLVLSGINKGYNMGNDMLYSGTVAAIFEAGVNGIPGIAVSTIPEDCRHAIASLDLIKAFFDDHHLLEKGQLYNVNIPENPKSICITRQGGPFYRDHFVTQDGEYYQQQGYCVYRPQDGTELDTDAIMNGHISITPLTIDRTDLSIYRELMNDLAGK